MTERIVHNKVLATNPLKRTTNELRQRQASWRTHRLVLRVIAIMFGGIDNHSLVLFERKAHAVVESDDQSEVEQTVVPGAVDGVIELDAGCQIYERGVQRPYGFAQDVHGGDTVTSINNETP